ncbi:hypothetical protein EES44_07300 [Streptomyces sp. ADI96-15]|jgi:hypothetical protein|nr:Hypothetical protein XNR_4363 [Streptomyces albidoflavus]ESP96991.1 Hypothetical protein B591_21911 [Streptomyces sp. GBA 94-10 4N24]ESQ03160.1 Hypothetical protein B590_21757 [Streptomyces sp. PVA_94-07]KAF0794334.1 hypothetical protein P405_05990 [Streptomyces sp. FR-008]RPK69433.1 hypothetical protein EES44_07300 [Streptomyces sp. ADI96-15]SCD49731.1 hypothetical protein GA0115250_11057 [Streptomyces sp. BvitLS-983]SCD67348.1 hypothetical protein GA0115236_116711 [Streptomyces sp. IgraM
MPARIAEKADHLLGQVPDQLTRTRVARTAAANDGG